MSESFLGISDEDIERMRGRKAVRLPRSPAVPKRHLYVNLQELEAQALRRDAAHYQASACDLMALLYRNWVAAGRPALALLRSQYDIEPEDE
jgi:hypothetical protein